MIIFRRESTPAHRPTTLIEQILLCSSQSISLWTRVQWFMMCVLWLLLLTTTSVEKVVCEAGSDDTMRLNRETRLRVDRQLFKG